MVNPSLLLPSYTMIDNHVSHIFSVSNGITVDTTNPKELSESGIVWFARFPFDVFL